MEIPTKQDFDELQRQVAELRSVDPRVRYEMWQEHLERKRQNSITA